MKIYWYPIESFTGKNLHDFYFSSIVHDGYYQLGHSSNTWQKLSQVETFTLSWFFLADCDSWYPRNCTFEVIREISVRKVKIKQKEGNYAQIFFVRESNAKTNLIPESCYLTLTDFFWCRDLRIFDERRDVKMSLSLHYPCKNK